MKLLIDIGNTRIKWGIAGNDAALLSSGALEHDAAAFARQLRAVSQQYAVQSIVISSVGKDALYQSVSSSTQTIFGITAKRFVSQDTAAGVTNSYREPVHLGADRWAAMMAAYRLYGGPVLICDCGTATTFDLVDAGGRHLGGYILPGLAMARRALAGGTAALPEVDGGELQPADETRAAIANGTVLSLVAGIEYLFAHYQQPQCVLTGGDAGFIGSFLSIPFHHDADLVLKGLAMMDSN